MKFSRAVGAMGKAMVGFVTHSDGVKRWNKAKYGDIEDSIFKIQIWYN